jgi:hypothetical protein
MWNGRRRATGAWRWMPDSACNGAAGAMIISTGPRLYDPSPPLIAITGPVASDQGQRDARTRTCMNDLGQALRLQVWDDRLNVEAFLP